MQISRQKERARTN